jgi:histidinol dehydrogenase
VLVVKQYVLDELGQDGLDRLCRRSEADISSLRQTVRPILDAVKDAGDAAIVRYTREFDRVDISAHEIEATEAEFDSCDGLLPSDVRSAIEVAAANIRTFHEAQMPVQMWFKEVSEGVLAGEKITPITSIGLYVPRGKGCFPSVMLMLAIPAVVAGVPQVVVCTPPAPDGTLDAATLYAAKVSGVRRVFRAGGAQAIAGMAFGTASIPRVRKVLGPGNSYVSAAKRELYGVLDVGVPAGPSESIILCDGTVSSSLAALDLLIEAEHGPDSAALLVCASREYAAEVEAILPSLMKDLPDQRRGFCEAVLEGYGGIVLAQNFDSALAFVNEFAPEHLEVLTDDPFAVLPKIKNAGEILLGRNAPITIGNYCLGVNAILPTGGFAHTFSCVTVFDYLKRTSIGYLGRDGYERLAPVARRLAEYEGFSSHAFAISKRT